MNRITGGILLSILIIWLIQITKADEIQVHDRESILTFIKQEQYSLLFLYNEQLKGKDLRYYEEFAKIPEKIRNSPLPINISVAKLDFTEIPKFTKKYFKTTKSPTVLFISSGKQIRYDGGHLVDNIYAWLKRIGRSAQLYSLPISTEEDIKSLHEYHPHSVIFFGELDSPEFEIVHAEAKKDPETRYAHCLDSDLKRLWNITKDIGIIINNKAEKEPEEMLGVYQTDAKNPNFAKEFHSFFG